MNHLIKYDVARRTDRVNRGGEAIASVSIWAVILGGVLGSGACGGKDPAEDVPVEPTMDASVGNVVSDTGARPQDVMENVSPCTTTGSICMGVRDPATLGPGIESVLSDSSKKNGQHFFCRPADPTAFNGRLLIHIVGTFDDPSYNASFMKTACALGFAAVSPMYENSVDARSTCQNESACYESFRREIVAGGDFAPDPVRVDHTNSIKNRLSTLLDNLVSSDKSFAAWVPLATAVKMDDFKKVVLSGHSQGSGHALFLARGVAAERLVLLAGPSDRLASGTQDNAPVEWIADLKINPPATLPSHILGYISEDDSLQGYDQVIDNWNAIGISQNVCRFAAAGLGPYSPLCRRVIIPSMGCSGLSAHLAVDVLKFGPMCQPGSGSNDNSRTWTFLLTTKL